MSLRTLIVLIILGALLLSIASMAAAYAFMRDQLQILFPDPSQAAAVEALKLVPVRPPASLRAFSTRITAVCFVVLSRYVIRPLQAMSEGIRAFAERSERISLSDFKHAPKEISELARVFNDFTIKVDDAHARDVEVSRMKSDFISTAAHQFRTPLTGIRWALEALEKEQLTESQMALVESAKGKSHQLVSIVGTLLDISAIESGKHKYDFQKTDMAALAREVAGEFGELAERSKVSLYFVPSEEAVPLVRADKTQVKWVLNNVIENALRYTPAGGSVRVMLANAPGRVFVHVIDTG